MTLTINNLWFAGPARLGGQDMWVTFPDCGVSKEWKLWIHLVFKWENQPIYLSTLVINRFIYMHLKSNRKIKIKRMLLTNHTNYWYIFFWLLYYKRSKIVRIFKLNTLWIYSLSYQHFISLHCLQSICNGYVDKCIRSVIKHSNHLATSNAIFPGWWHFRGFAIQEENGSIYIYTI